MVHVLVRLDLLRRLVAPEVPADSGAHLVDQALALFLGSERARPIIHGLCGGVKMFLLFDMVLLYVPLDYLDLFGGDREEAGTALTTVRALAILREVVDTTLHIFHHFL